jgi:hypothetical protein
MATNEDLEEKKLLGSGGYAFAKLTEQEEIGAANLGVPHVFFAKVGRLSEDRFSKHYCNKCAIEYPGSPLISYENPNEELGEGVILIENGEYRCKVCNNVLAIYRKFNK